MNDQERFLARVMFANRIYRSDGQAFEDVFTQIMGYRSADFIPVKPQGTHGDRKNDGYNRQSGHYYQVFAPESPDSAKARAAAVAKLATDFAGLRAYWHATQPIKRFSFVFNDKYKGSFPTIETDLHTLRQSHDLEHCGCFLAKHLEDELFALADDKILMVVGGIPDASKIENVDYSILAEVVAAIRTASQAIDSTTILQAPDFEEKLAFNGLSGPPSSLLRAASYQRGQIDKYFERNSTFAKQELRDAINRIYLDVRNLETSTADDRFSTADVAFFEILKRISPTINKATQDAALVVMAYFFESCDIFEDPTTTAANDATA